jgi:hypothetical protein
LLLLNQAFSLQPLIELSILRLEPLTEKLKLKVRLPEIQDPVPPLF